MMGKRVEIVGGEIWVYTACEMCTMDLFLVLSEIRLLKLNRWFQRGVADVSNA